MSEPVIILIPVVLLVVVISCILFTGRVLNSAAHYKRLSDIAAARFARALKEEGKRACKRQPQPSSSSSRPPIIPFLALQPDASFLLAVPEQFPPQVPAPPPSRAARALPVSEVVQQGFSAHTREPVEAATTGEPASVWLNEPVEGAEDPESVRPPTVSASSCSLDLDGRRYQHQPSTTEAATNSYKIATESLLQASFRGPQQLYGPEVEASSEPLSASPVPPQVADIEPLALFPSSAEAPESPTFSVASSGHPSSGHSSSGQSGDLEMLSGHHSQRERQHSQPYLAAQSPHSSPSARSTCSKGALQHSPGASRQHRSASANSSPLQHSHAAVQSNTSVPAPNARLLDSSSSQGSLAQPGTASSSFARTVSGRSSSRRSQSGVPAQFSQESVHSIPGPWSSIQHRPVVSTDDMDLIATGIGSREASPPVSALPPAVAAAQARAAQAASFEGEAIAASESRPSSIRRFSTGSVVGHSQGSPELEQDEQTEIVPAEGQQQQRRATVSSGVSLADQIERALHAASSGKSPPAESPAAAASRPPLAPRKERAAAPVSKGAIRRTRLLEAMALIGRPLVPGLDDANDVAAATCSGLAPVVASPSDGQPLDNLGVTTTSAGQHGQPHSRDAWELGVINENSLAGSSSVATRAAQSENARSSQDSQRTSSPSSSYHVRRRALSGNPSVSSAGHTPIAHVSNSSPLWLTHEELQESRHNAGAQASNSSPFRLTHEELQESRHNAGAQASNSRTSRLSHEVLQESRRTAVHAQTQTHSSDAFSDMENLQSEVGSTSAFSAALSQAMTSLSALAVGEVKHSSRVAAATASAVAAATAAHEAAFSHNPQPQPPAPQQPGVWQELLKRDIPHDRLVRHNLGSIQQHFQPTAGSLLGPSESSDSEVSPVPQVVATERHGVSALVTMFEPPVAKQDQHQQIVAERHVSSSKLAHHMEPHIATLPAAVEPSDVEHSMNASASQQETEDVLETASTGVCQAVAQTLAAAPPRQDTATEAVYSAEPPRSNDDLATITPMRERVRPSKTPSFASTSTCTTHPAAPASLGSLSASVASAPVGATSSSYYNLSPESAGKGRAREKVLPADAQSVGSTQSMPVRPVTIQPAKDRKSCSRPITARAFYRSGPSRTVRVHPRNIVGPVQVTSAQCMHVPGWEVSASVRQVSSLTRDSETARAIARAEDACFPSASSGTTRRGPLSLASTSSADLASQDDEWGQFSHQNSAALRTPRFASSSWRSSQSDVGPDIDSARLGGDTPQNQPTVTAAGSHIDADATSAGIELLGVRRHVFAGRTASGHDGGMPQASTTLQYTRHSVPSGDNRQAGAAGSAMLHEEDNFSEVSVGEVESSVVLHAPLHSAATASPPSQHSQHSPPRQAATELTLHNSVTEDSAVMLSPSVTATQSVTLTPFMEDSASALERWTVSEQAEGHTSEASEAAMHAPSLALEAGVSDVGQLLSTEVSASSQSVMYSSHVPEAGTVEGASVPAASGGQEQPTPPVQAHAQHDVAPSGPECVYLSPHEKEQPSVLPVEDATKTAEAQTPVGKEESSASAVEQQVHCEAPARHAHAQLEHVLDDSSVAQRPESTTATDLAAGTPEQLCVSSGVPTEQPVRAMTSQAATCTAADTPAVVCAVAVGIKGADAGDIRIVSAVLPSVQEAQAGPSSRERIVTRPGGHTTRRDERVVAELDDAFSALAAAALQMQHALEESEEDTWQATAAEDAQHLHDELMVAAAFAQSAEPEGDQEEARSEASTTDAPWSTGSSCGGEVVQVVHEGWGSGDLPDTISLPSYQFAGNGEVDGSGMATYPAQVHMDPHLNMRRREVAPLEMWVPVAMETIVEEESCDAEAESYKGRERAYTFSGVTADGDARSHVYETGPSYRHLAQPSAQASEYVNTSSPSSESEEPRWVVEERRSPQQVAEAASFDAPHPYSMVPSTAGPSTAAATSSSVTPPEVTTTTVPQASSAHQALGAGTSKAASAYPAPQMPVTSPAVPQMPVAASPGTESTLSHTPGKLDGRATDTSAVERSRAAAVLAVPSLMMNHMREGSGSLGGSTAGSVSGSNPCSARRILPAAVASWLDSPAHFAHRHEGAVRMRRESDSGAAVGARHRLSDAGSRPRTMSDTGSDVRSGMFRPRGAGSGSARTSASWSSCPTEHTLDGAQVAGSWADGSVQDIGEVCEPETSLCGGEQDGRSSLLLPPPQQTGLKHASGPVGEGAEDSDDSGDLSTVDLQPHPAPATAGLHRHALQAKPMGQHRSSLPPRLQGHAAGVSARSRWYGGEDSVMTRTFKPHSPGEQLLAAPVRSKQAALASIRQSAPVLASLPEDPLESSSSMYELKRRVQAAAASARESTHLIPPLQQQQQQQAAPPARINPYTYMPQSPPEFCGAVGAAAHADVTDTWPPQPDSLASDKHLQEITLALTPYPASSAATGCAAMSPCGSLTISGAITIRPASAGIPDVVPPTVDVDATHPGDSLSCDSVPLHAGFDARAHSVHRTRPASIAWSAYSDLLEEDVHSVSRAGSSVRSHSQSRSLSLISHRRTSAASGTSRQEGPWPHPGSQAGGAGALTKPLPEYQTMSPLYMMFSLDQSVHVGRAAEAPAAMGRIGEGAEEMETSPHASGHLVHGSIEGAGFEQHTLSGEAVHTVSRRSTRLPRMVESDDSEDEQGPHDVQKGVQQARVSTGCSAGIRTTRLPSPRVRGASLRRTRGSRVSTVQKKGPDGAAGYRKSSVAGHRANTLERWMAAAQEAVHLMTLPDAARKARMHDPFDNLPSDVEWVVVGVEAGQSPWLDNQLPAPSAAQRSSQVVPAVKRGGPLSAAQHPDSRAASLSDECESAGPRSMRWSSAAGSRRGARGWRGSISGGEGSEGAGVEQYESAGSDAGLEEIMVIR